MALSFDRALFEFSPAFFDGVVPFFLYVLVSILVTLIFLRVYSWSTPYNEWHAIRENQNTAAGISLGGALIGFSIPAAEALKGSVSLLDYGSWALLAMVVQIAVFWIVHAAFPSLSSRIEQKKDVSAAAFLALSSVAAGILNAACMSS